jgi:N-carbamoyl-L-amino-acid hydrolase
MTEPVQAIRIDGTRLWSRLTAMAVHGATPAGGCNRQALTDEDKAGRDMFTAWCEAAGCTIRIDSIGNIFARRAGRDQSLPPVITGSHLDTQPSGGKYDGIYGVLAGLEVIEALNDSNTMTQHPLEVVVWTNEEGCRFDMAMMGSAVWSGTLPLESAYSLADREGHSVRDELARIDYLGTEPAAVAPVHAAFELHIEQGPVLEAESKEIGIVTGVQHMSRHRAIIGGVEAHAGPTPMTMRKDPMMALADFLPQLYALAEAHGPDARITFGFIHAQPGSSNTVPGQLELTADIRHPDGDNYRTMLKGFTEAVTIACERFSLPLELSCFWEAPGVVFDHNCVEAVRRAVDHLAYSNRDIVSGAGHDACNVSAVVPTSMIFIPCKGGLSHNEAEAISCDQAEAGANVLLHAMLQRAGTA